MTETRKLAAILVSDIAGYSRLAGADEDKTLARLRPTRAERTTCGFSALRGRSRLQLRQRADLHPHARRLGRRLDHFAGRGTADEGAGFARRNLA